MLRRGLGSVLCAGAVVLSALGSGPAPKAKVTISSQPLHAGRVDPKLFGNFMELLDDLVPGMWAEMLNDRSFEGVTKPANWVYGDGAPNVCDREWITNRTWTCDGENAFNGSRNARLTATRAEPASLTQPDLVVKSGAGYVFSGYFRTDNPSLAAKVLLRFQLPDGRWMALATAKLPALLREWRKYTVQLVPGGQTDRAVFELRAEGWGTLWADKLSLTPADTAKGWRPDVVAAIKDTRPAVIRWGGSVCDPGAYRWKNGIGDRDSRTPFANKVWGRIDSNDVGIDEFCQFCELTDAEPLVCVSFSDGPQNAADLVQYCNGDRATAWGAKRVANGHPQPYRVKYWQIGNEISGDNEDYLERFYTFAQAMKQADASATLIASFPSQKLLDRVGRDIACIGPHHYTPDFGGCEGEFNNLAQMIRATPGCEHIRIAVTEWNVSAGSWGVLRSKFQTLQTALLNARYLHLLMRHSDKVDIACRSNMANSLGSGVIETRPSGLLRRPSYYVMQLYARHAKTIPLRVEASTDGLDVFACGAQDRKSLVVFAVNSRRAPIECALNFDGFARPVRIANAEALGDTREAGQPDAMNHWSAPDRVRTFPLSPFQNNIVLPALSAAAIECEPFQLP